MQEASASFGSELNYVSNKSANLLCSKKLSELPGSGEVHWECTGNSQHTPAFHSTRGSTRACIVFTTIMDETASHQQWLFSPERLSKERLTANTRGAKCEWVTKAASEMTPLNVEEEQVRDHPTISTEFHTVACCRRNWCTFMRAMLPRSVRR